MQPVKNEHVLEFSLEHEMSMTPPRPPEMYRPNADSSQSRLLPAPSDWLPPWPAHPNTAASTEYRAAEVAGSATSASSTASSDGRPSFLFPDSVRFIATSSAAVRSLSPTVLEHRRCDGARRRRERAALERLEELSMEKRHSAAKQANPSADSLSTAAATRPKRKRYKLSVLEASAARIEWLERLLEEAGRDKQLLCAEVSGMVTRERQSLQWQETHRALCLVRAC